MKKRKFKKSYTRSMALIDIQSWYEGERHGLDEITSGHAYFDPLFIYRKEGLTDVYYDVNEVEAAVVAVKNYFQDNPRKFYRLAKTYRQYCVELETLCKQRSLNDLSKIFNLVCNIWPMISATVVLGEFIEHERVGNIARRALDLRSETGEIVYLAADTLLELARKNYPRLSDFIEFLSFEEIESQHVPNFGELEDRKVGFIYFKGYLYPNYPVSKLERKHNLVIEKDEIVEIDELKGQVASKGKVRGKVRVMLTTEAMENFQDGEVLVSIMTTPDFLPIMKKASAFVTDEGGITSHAAIVSREFGVPCIVGTRIATKVLKDGDLVEVDAEKGVVRKIK